MLFTGIKLLFSAGKKLGINVIGRTMWEMCKEYGFFMFYKENFQNVLKEFHSLVWWWNFEEDQPAISGKKQAFKKFSLQHVIAEIKNDFPSFYQDLPALPDRAVIWLYWIICRKFSWKYQLKIGIKFLILLLWTNTWEYWKELRDVFRTL